MIADKSCGKEISALTSRGKKCIIKVYYNDYLFV